MADDSQPEVPRKSWPQACAHRLDRHALAMPVTGVTPAQIVARMCGAHAQIMTAAEWSIGLRVEGVTRADVQAAVWGERSLVKTFGPRGTVHLLPAADLASWTGAMSAIPRPGQGLASAFLTPDQADAVLAAIAAGLRSAELTVDELTEAVVGECGSWAGDLVIPAFDGMWPRWRQALPLAAARGVLCFGPGRGRKVTFANPRAWLPGFEPAAAPDALRWLVTQYLWGYGPGTAGQFAQWLGAPRRWAAELFAQLAPGLQRVELAGATSWLPLGAPPLPDPPCGVRLLPYFDAYVVGCHPRTLLFPGVAAERALNRTGQAGTLPVLLVDGVVQGVWHQRRSGRRLAITIESFGELTPGQRAEVSDQAERLGEFFGCAPRITLGPVSARSHL